ncbi:pyridoxal phosphate-dependent decarboxylase family protein [Microlunatus speluncae]|uniref:pyridoxal phosphate-dependent decarboxylase family protein n=1 Tax=Microlunatus speluncae TaxID=2594267 RepID=UPI0012664241|nr:pyridoxal-dependent decarboxylase [Microlunatus speluncae]
MSELLSSTTADRYATLLESTTRLIADQVAAVSQPFSGASRAELQRLVDDVDLDAAGLGTEAAVQEVGRLFLPHAVWFHDPSYAAHLNCPVALPAVAAEAVLAAVNPSVDTYDQSTIGTLMERRLVDWTARRIGFADGDGIFTSGGTQSNLQALLLAREHTLLRNPALSRADGLPRLRILATASSHFSVAKAALLLGLGEDAVIKVADDGAGRMDPAALDAALTEVRRAGGLAMAVVATAGTTDRGVIDPVDAIADRCERAEVWLHVDAAYGCGLLVSRRRRSLLVGIERAHSVTVDYHKSFFQPVSSSAVIIRDPAAFAPTVWHADYLNPRQDAEPNQVDKSLQTTRRFDALKLWTTLRALGAERLGELFDSVIDLARAVHDEVAADRDLELVGRSQLSTVLFRYAPAGLDEAARDSAVPAIRRALFESGRAHVAKTMINGRPCLKLTLLNPDAGLDDVRRILLLIKRTGAALAGIEPGDVLDQQRSRLRAAAEAAA